MSVKQVKDIRVTCPNGHQVIIPKEVWKRDVVEVEDKPDHGMGPKIHHKFFVDDYACDYPGCAASVDAEVDVCEYPIGTLEPTVEKSENVVGKVDDCFESQLD